MSRMFFLDYKSQKKECVMGVLLLKIYFPNEKESSSMTSQKAIGEEEIVFLHNVYNFESLDSNKQLIRRKLK